MRARRQQHDDWGESDAEVYQGYEAAYDEGDYADPADYDMAADEDYGDDEERGLILRKDESLVGVSSTVTHHGAPILSYTRTMNRFYTSRKQRLSLGRHRCEVCGDRIRFWSFQTPTGTHTHDGCYERLAWTWTNLYAQQQRLASEGLLE
jgi:hypothetical protein